MVSDAGKKYSKIFSVKEIHCSMKKFTSFSIMSNVLKIDIKLSHNRVKQRKSSYADKIDETWFHYYNINTYIVDR